MSEALKVWTVQVAHQTNPYSLISWGTPRPWKTFTVNKKVRQDSPSEFTAQIEYDSTVVFNDLIKFERDGAIEWMGFVEDIEILWDEKSRYLNIGGRDLTLLLWRKYVENFNNSIANTLGFFGNVNAAELIKFLLRTPRSDLPEVADDNIVGDQSVYPYNKEGWGIDISNFTGLETSQRVDISGHLIGYGDINTTILRKREMVWGNSGSPFNSSLIASEGIIDTVVSCTWEEYGSYPYIQLEDGITPSNYIKSHIYVNDTAEFTFAPLAGGDNATAINSCYLAIKQAPDMSWGGPFFQSNCQVYIWVDSQNTWSFIGNFGGKSSVFGPLAWQTFIFDLSSILKIVSDINNAKVRFVETGSLSTYIQYVYLSTGYVGSGDIQAGEWVNVEFNSMVCMGVYIESREHLDQFPQNYHITTSGGLELFSGYIEHDGDTYITLDAAKDQLTFDSYQSDDPSKIAYFYRQGINAAHIGPIGDFDESISFLITSSQPCTSSPDYDTPAFIPWCLANEVNDFYTIESGIQDYTCFDVVNVSGTLYPQFRFRSGGSETRNTTLPALTIGTLYWLHVTRSGSTLIYSLYNAQTMRASELVVSQTFSCADTYIYRYQAITYNHEEWANLFTNLMDSYYTSGEQVVNGGFEIDSGPTHYLYGWTASAGVAATNTEAHTGSRSAMFTALGANIAQSGFNVLQENVTSASIWHKCPLGATFNIELDYTSGFTSWTVIGTGAWTEENLLAHFVAGKILTQVYIVYVMAGGAPDPMYIDDLSILAVPSGWTTGSGTATRSTNTSKQRLGQTACQQIHCTTDGQYYYFEEDLSVPSDTVRVDAWIRTPPSHSENTSGDVLALNFTPSGGNHWLTDGSYPYVRDNSDMDNNHIYFTANNAPVIAFEDYIAFENIATAFGKSWYYAVIPDSNSKLSISARIQNNVGGTGTLHSVSIQAFLWVSHSNSWVLIGDSGIFTQTIWQNLFTPIDIHTYLTSYKDWADAKVKFSYYGWGGTSGDPTKAQFQIGQVKLIFSGTASGGQVDLLKLYNSSVGIGTPSAVVGVRGSEYASSSQDFMRYYLLGHGENVTNGEWNSALPAGGSTGADFPVPDGSLDSPDPWVNIRLEVHIGNGDGYVNLYDITSGSPVLLCGITGLNNTSDGIIDRLDFEAEYYYDYGNSSTYDTYLNEIDVYGLGETHTLGTINAGYGPETTLVTVTNNFYPDLLHSWCPQQMSNIKIYVDDAETGHGWEITQIYVYRTDPVKYRVVLDSCTALTKEYKLTFNSIGYVDCEDSDNGLVVYHNSFDDEGPNYIGTLLNFDNDSLEWRVDVTGGNYIPQAGDIILLYTTNGGSGTGTGTLLTDAPSVWSGGPYLYLGDENIDLSMFTQDELIMIGPVNIPKNRLLDTMWDITVYVNDDYTPFEWWITYPSIGDPTRCIGDFHIGPRKGIDKSGSISFTTGVNMEGVKYQKSSRDTYQRCQVIGTGEGKNQDDCSSFWQNDQDAMDETQGFFEDIVTQKQVSGGRIANRYAKVKLKLDASPKRKNAITCLIGRDTYTSFDGTNPTDPNTYDVGDDVTLTDFLSNLSGSYRLWNSQVKVDNNGEVVTLTAQAPYLDISNVWKDVYKQLKTIGAQGTIAQDWAGQGANAKSVSADKLTTLFTKTAKNEETKAQSTTDPQWFTGPSPTHNAGWKADSGNLTIWGGDSGGLGETWVEARYNTQYDTNGNKLMGEVVDIPMDQEPKFTCTFKIFEKLTYPTAYWNTGDYVDLGMFKYDDGTGFLVRVLCTGPDEFKAYAIFCSEMGDYVPSIDTLIANGKAKLLCSLTFNHKYKATIQVEYNGVQYGNPLPEVVVSITDEEADNPVSQNVVWTKFNSPSFAGGTNSVFQNIIIRPIFILVSGTGDSSHRCQMMFYDIKTERDVV